MRDHRPCRGGGGRRRGRSGGWRCLLLSFSCVVGLEGLMLDVIK